MATLYCMTCERETDVKMIGTIPSVALMNDPPAKKRFIVLPVFECQECHQKEVLIDTETRWQRFVDINLDHIKSFEIFTKDGKNAKLKLENKG